MRDNSETATLERGSDTIAVEPLRLTEEQLSDARDLASSDFSLSVSEHAKAVIIGLLAAYESLLGELTTAKSGTFVSAQAQLPAGVRLTRFEWLRQMEAALSATGKYSLAHATAHAENLANNGGYSNYITGQYAAGKLWEAPVV